jgi:hypothetical protein
MASLRNDQDPSQSAAEQCSETGMTEVLNAVGLGHRNTSI